jgi:hypothetical protein
MEKCKEQEPTTVLEPGMFTNIALLEPEDTIERICQSQNCDSDAMKQWREEHHKCLSEDPDRSLTY